MKTRLSAQGMALGAAAVLAAAAGWAAQENIASLAADAELVETRTAVPRLLPPAAYEPKDNVVDIELSEYAGYAGLVVANGGLEPSDDSVFARKHGFKVRIRLSEEDSWSALNSGKLGVSASTADVLPLYGNQLKVKVPALISFSRGADALVARAAIRQINDLKGKTVAIAQFNESDFFLRYLAQQAGLEVNPIEDLGAKRDPQKINVVACADAFGAGDLFLRDLKAGRSRVDACMTWEPKTTEVVDGSGGKAKALVSNRNLLIIADILMVNEGLAAKHPEMVKGLVAGLLEGNRLVREKPADHLKVIAKAFGWTEDDAREELKKVHFANLPENQAFFAGTIDAAGSYGYIYESATMAYGTTFIPRAASAERFVSADALKAAEASGAFAGQRADIEPIRSAGAPVEEPLLARDIRFLFQANSAELDMNSPKNLEDLAFMAKMLQVSPGSTLLLRGHVDNSRVKEFEKAGATFLQTMTLKAVQLSKDRCESVRGALVRLHKVDAARIESVGVGWKEPLGADMEKNRRVEVQWFTVE